MTDPTTPPSPHPAGNVLTVLFRRDARNSRAANKSLILQGNAQRLADPDRITRLLDRARARREKALTERDQGVTSRLQGIASRDRCVVQTTADGRTVTNHIFDQVPRLGALIERTGPDVFLLSIRLRP